MNGAECGECGNIQCTCPKIVVHMSGKPFKDFEKDTNKLYLALTKPRGIRLRLMRWLYPEIVRVADSLRKCYWSK